MEICYIHVLCSVFNVFATTALGFLFLELAKDGLNVSWPIVWFGDEHHMMVMVMMK